MDLATLTSKVVSQAAKADALGSSIKFAFEEGAILLDGNGAENKVSNEDGEADCTVKISMEDFASLMSGDLNPMGAFMGGKMKIEGDMGVAMKLQSLF